MPGLSESVERDHRIQRPERVVTERESNRSKRMEHQSRGDRSIASFWRKRVLGKGQRRGRAIADGEGEEDHIQVGWRPYLLLTTTLLTPFKGLQTKGAGPVSF